jgi:phosphoglycerate dehydrogenase-like enzyme
MSGTFTVGVTSDALRPGGSTMFGDVGLHRLTDEGIDWRVLPAITEPIDPAILEGLDAVLAFGHQKFDEKLVRQTPRLSLLARFGAGVDGIDLDGLAQAGVVVSNTPVAVRTPMALATLTMILALAHRALENHNSVVSGNWTTGRGALRGMGVAGRTLGIVGYGGIGSELAALARGLGFTVVVSDHPSTRERASRDGLQSLPLMELASASDYVAIMVGLSEATTHLVDAQFLSAMKPTGYLVNTSRGGLVDHDALLDALSTGTIAGAGLDVLDPEPPLADSPLLALPNVLFSAHCLSWTADFTEAVSASVIASITAAARGERPEHTVNPTVYDYGWRRERDLVSQGLKGTK